MATKWHIPTRILLWRRCLDYQKNSGTYKEVREHGNTTLFLPQNPKEIVVVGPN